VYEELYHAWEVVEGVQIVKPVSLYGPGTPMPDLGKPIAIPDRIGRSRTRFAGTSCKEFNWGPSLKKVGTVRGDRIYG